MPRSQKARKARNELLRRALLSKASKNDYRLGSKDLRRVARRMSSSGVTDIMVFCEAMPELDILRWARWVLVLREVSICTTHFKEIRAEKGGFEANKGY